MNFIEWDQAKAGELVILNADITIGQPSDVPLLLKRGLKARIVGKSLVVRAVKLRVNFGKDFEDLKKVEIPACHFDRML